MYRLESRKESANKILGEHPLDKTDTFFIYTKYKK
jgi:hypothetical protein